jgi:hypothetical protein
MVGGTLGYLEDSVIRGGNLIVSFRLSTGSAPTFWRVPPGPGVVPFPDDTDARLWVDPKTDSVDSFGEGNTGTGESGARMASTEALVNRDHDGAAATNINSATFQAFTGCCRVCHA